jgi:hypothetical protein
MAFHIQKRKLACRTLYYFGDQMKDGETAEAFSKDGKSV